MAMVVEKQVAVEANQARLEGNAKGGQGKSSSNLNETSEPIRTASKAAESIGVSENTYRDMKLVTEKGSEEQISLFGKKLVVGVTPPLSRFSYPPSREQGFISVRLSFRDSILHIQTTLPRRKCSTILTVMRKSIKNPLQSAVRVLY